MIQSDFAQASSPHYSLCDKPKVMIEPEPVYTCDLGGYVTISPLVYGANLVFHWEAILDETVRIIEGQHGQSLTIGPITVADLKYRYRLVARDCNGMCVSSITSRIQLKEEIRDFNFEVSIQKIDNNHRKLKSILTEADSNISRFSIEKTLDELYQAELPIFVTQPKDSSVRFGATLMLQCQLFGAVSYTWYLNGDPIQDSNNCILQISNVSIHYEGVYVCAARNEFGITCSEAVFVTLFN